MSAVNSKSMKGMTQLVDSAFSGTSWQWHLHLHKASGVGGRVVSEEVVVHDASVNPILTPFLNII